MNTLEMIDNDGDWFINIGAFRMVDPETGHFFEPSVKYKIKATVWMEAQPTIVATTIEEDTSERQLTPKEPNSPRVEPDPAKVDTKKK